MIANRVNFMKKREKRQAKGKLSLFKNLTTTKEEQIADEDNIILVPEFEFPHGIFKIAYTELNVEGLCYAYNKLANFLNFRNKPDLGITIIVSPSWMFVAQLT